jgi:hypothetical protein
MFHAGGMMVLSAVMGNHLSFLARILVAFSPSL